MYFAQGRLKMILTSFIITFSVNVGGDILLIPFFKNEGAAFAFLAACVAQTIYYLKKNDINQLGDIWRPLVICTLGALVSGFIAEMLFSGSWLMLPVSIALFAACLFISGQFTISDQMVVKRLFKR